ncbi:PTS sugar transporter subunit IIB [Brachybacterium endophyticum]|uniref:PTS sugar transporter subunit IIB n=1 Tax=Brachybacterium endophyticum TaxID=2182385 RepID=A0A2U2RNH9_9MICO|nr:PTS sugar transporter subunit IIB [Brachybacterium endophyticum]PWH07430.1 PTS sugar transporter subunit IIB [Brachybacterium endophyticum]
MADLRVMLVCGSGASSGFMASNIRKAAAKRDLDIEAFARGESEIENYVSEIDALMIGPHLGYLFEEIDDVIGEADVAVVLMRPDYYAALDGDAALEHLLEAFSDADDAGTADDGSEAREARDTSDAEAPVAP